MPKYLIVDITLDDLRLFEVDLDGQFKAGLIEDDDVILAEKKGHNPRVIVRTYEAVLSLSVTSAKSLSAEAWNKALHELKSAGGDIADSSTVVFKGDRSTAIAYETATVSFFTTYLRRAQPNAVELRDAPAVNEVAAKLDLSAFNLTVGAPGIRYVLLGNSRYRSAEFANLRAVEPSVQIVESVFYGAGAEPLVTEELSHVLNDATMDQALSRITNELRSTEPSLFVLYYVGHAISSAEGQLYLVLENYNGNLAHDLGEHIMLGLSRAQLDNQESAVMGSNLGDLLNVSAAIAGEFAPKVPGLYPVGAIAKHLEEVGIPFVVLIDACFEYEGMEELRSALKLTKYGDYYGPMTMAAPERWNCMPMQSVNLQLHHTYDRQTS